MRDPGSYNIPQTYLYTNVSGNSANWNSTYTTVESNSATWSAGSIPQNLSFDEDSNTLSISYGNTVSLSALSSSNSGDVFVNTLVRSNSANWDSVYTNVNSSSGDWNYQGSDIKALTANWESTYTIINSSSANWNDVYTTVYDTSGSWNYQGSDVKSLTANWDNTYTTVNTNSAAWGAGGTPQNLSFDESSSLLSISDGNTVSLSALSGNGPAVFGDYLPLSGGTLTGDLEIQGDITAIDSIQFTLTAGVASEPGLLTWNAEESTLNLGINDSVTLQLGQETLIQVKNTSGEIIYNGMPVYASGASGGGSGNITVSAYRAGVNDVNELYFLGVATQDLADNDFGFITTFGKVRDVVASQVQATDDVGALSAWPIGTILYPSATQAGKFTSTPPIAPNKDIPAAMVISVNGNKRGFFVRAEHGYHLDELHDVANITPENDNVLTFNSLSGVWYPKALETNYLPLSGGTLTGTLSTTGEVYSQSGNSQQWNSTYTNVQTNSSSWSSVYSSFNTQSADNTSVYSTVQSNSADTWNYQGTDVKSLTSNWESTYTTVNTSSAQWAIDTSVDTQLRSLTSNWENTYTYFSVQSGDNASVYSTVQSNSANWDSTYTEYLTQSANYYSTYTTVYDTSGSWNYQGSDIKSLTANWENTYTTVYDTSGSWNYQGSDVKSLTANWENTYTDFSAQSANNTSVYTTVNSNSATWSAGGGSGADTAVRELTANWESTYTTVQSESGNWGTGGSPQTLSFNDSNGVLSISNGNTVSLSALSSTPVGLYRDIWIGAGAMVPRTTNGADPQTVEFATNGVNLDVFDFDAATEEGVNFSLAMPDEWDLGTIMVKFYWTAASGSGSVVFGIRAKANSDDDAIDSAYGTEQLVTDTLITADDSHISSASSALTVGGTPALGDLIIFEVTREVGDASDTLGVDARLIGVSIQYKELNTNPVIW